MLLGVVFILLLVCGVPVAFTLGLTGAAYISWQTSLPPLVAFQRMFASVDSFPFMAIPFFMLAGNLMYAGGLADRIIEFSRSLVGHLQGGLANVLIVANMFFAGVSGSSVADASALGSILIPAMKKEGYSAKFAGAINSTSSTIGIIIPPSIPMILVGVATGLSIRKLFMGGLVPGILVGLGMMAITTFIAKRRNYPKYPRATMRELLRTGWRGLPAFVMVLIIMGGILGGIFTPTEASVVAVLFGLVVGLLSGKLNRENLFKAFLDSAISSAVVLMVISTAGLLTWLLAYSMVPQQLAVYLGSVIHSPKLLMTILGLTFLMVGTVLDVSPAVLLFGPVLLPVITTVGVDPIFFGVFMVFVLAIGLFTPPVGTTMMISAYLAEASLLDVARECIPYLCLMIGLMFLLILCEGTVLWVPTLLFG